MKRLLTTVFLISILIKAFGQQDIEIGLSYQLNLQRQNLHGDAWILHNAIYSPNGDLLKWKSTHSSFGSRGIRFTYSSGIYFYADNSNTIGGSEFTPTTRFFIGNNGNIGIGEIAPDQKLNITHTEDISTSNQYRYPLKLVLFDNGGGLWQGTGVGMKFNIKASNANFDAAEIIGIAKTAGTTNGDLIFRTAKAGVLSTHLTINSDGNIGIGTVTLGYELDVIGTIRAREVKVDLEGADFVFENDYNLRSLEELEYYVKKNKHLPEIELASEMEKNGVDLGELNTKLLQKIEELTLYMIDINKRVKSLEEENKELKKENSILKTQ